MTPEYQKLREDAMQRGWEINERYSKECRAFVIFIQKRVNDRLIGSQFAYSNEDRDMARYGADILRLRFLNMVEEAEAELTKVGPKRLSRIQQNPCGHTPPPWETKEA